MIVRGIRMKIKRLYSENAFAIPRAIIRLFNSFFNSSLSSL